MKLLVATRNAGKVAELARLLEEHELVSVPPDLPEIDETGSTFAANALLKARGYAAEVGLPTLADDSGLEVDALEGAPGIHSARYAGRHGDDAANNAKLLHALAEVEDDARTARFRCALAFFDPTDGTEHVEHGVIEGVILRSARGEGGFGYDPLFLPRGESRTTAEMPADEKNAISHRADAVRKMRRFLGTRER